MRAVIQRVTFAEVKIDGVTVGKIGNGILILLGVADGDGLDEVKYLADKIIGLRIFEDEKGKMNLSLEDVGGELLIVSQFTLYGDCKKGRRPSFDKAARPDLANRLYEDFIAYAKSKVKTVETGRFGADMKISLINDGPVTLIIDTPTKA